MVELEVKFARLYGSMQLFVSLAVMVLGVNIIMLASMDSISANYLFAGAVAVFASLFLIIANLRKRIV